MAYPPYATVPWKRLGNNPSSGGPHLIPPINVPQNQDKARPFFSTLDEIDSRPQKARQKLFHAPMQDHKYFMTTCELFINRHTSHNLRDERQLVWNPIRAPEISEELLEKGKQVGGARD
jgi:hypothetical protein